MRNTIIKITLSIIFVLLTFNATVYSDDIASTPKTHYVCTWEPYTYDPYSYDIAISIHDAEALVENLWVEGDYSQGYVFYRYQDFTPDDESFNSCTRQNWDYLANDTGILLLNTHGYHDHINGVYTKHVEMLFDPNNSPHGWADGDNDGFIDPNMQVVGDNVYWWVRVHPTWLYNHFQQELEENNAIVFHCSCHSADPFHDDTPLKKCYGAIGFGYAGETSYENSNIEGLIMLMNGRIYNYGYRDAQNDYLLYQWGWTDGWIYYNPDNNKITLCPIVKEAKLYPDYGNPMDITYYYPFGAGLSGSGHIQFDTHCQTVEEPAAAVNSYANYGSGYIYNQSWYDDHTITFDYCCYGSYSLTLWACPYYIHGSPLGTLNLDGNAVAPNDDYYLTSFSN